MESCWYCWRLSLMAQRLKVLLDAPCQHRRHMHVTHVCLNERRLYWPIAGAGSAACRGWIDDLLLHVAGCCRSLPKPAVLDVSIMCCWLIWCPMMM